MAKFIVIEGLDGSGKRTLTQRLSQYWTERNKLVAQLSFPDYVHSACAQLADRCLHGSYPFILEDPLAMALLFAADRLQSRAALREYLSHCDYVLADRYVASNIAYTAARLKVQNLDEIDWLSQIEFDEFALPKPQLQILVSTSQEIAAQRIMQREVTESDRVSDHYENDKNLQCATLDWYRTMVHQAWISPWRVFSTTDNYQELAEYIDNL